MESNPTVGIIGGTGNLGKGIALRFAKAGLKVVIGSRTPDKAKTIASQVNERVGMNSAKGLHNSEVFAEARHVFITIPFQHVKSTLEQLTSFISEKHVIIDTTVPLVFVNGKPRLDPPPEGSAAELIQRHLPSNIKLVTALKTISAHALENISKPLERTTFVCGDDKKAKNEIIMILQKIEGLNPVDAGALHVSRYVEPMTVLAIYLNKQFRAKSVGFKVVFQ